MKSSLLFASFILAISHCILLVSASPAATPASSAGTPEESAIKKAVDWMEANPTKLNPSCFYSGYTTVAGKKVEAQHIVNSEWIDKKLVPYNCRLIGEIVEQSGANPDDIKDWSTVSEKFAQLVAGKVYVLLGKVVEANSIWLKKESPALKKNNKVTEVEGWEIGADGKPAKKAKKRGTV
ncbi:hypothetical protein C0991_008509 [Blastosporella zonata]|nr:hypothetical protein C0991_008509 [Blastosporella zonata]